MDGGDRDQSRPAKPLQGKLGSAAAGGFMTRARGHVVLIGVEIADAAVVSAYYNAGLLANQFSYYFSGLALCNSWKRVSSSVHSMYPLHVFLLEVMWIMIIIF